VHGVEAAGLERGHEARVLSRERRQHTLYRFQRADRLAHACELERPDDPTPPVARQPVQSAQLGLDRGSVLARPDGPLDARAERADGLLVGRDSERVERCEVAPHSALRAHDVGEETARRLDPRDLGDRRAVVAAVCDLLAHREEGHQGAGQQDAGDHGAAPALGDAVDQPGETGQGVLLRRRGQLGGEARSWADQSPAPALAPPSRAA
jgi:hypothetical protein